MKRLWHSFFFDSLIRLGIISGLIVIAGAGLCIYLLVRDGLHPSNESITRLLGAIVGILGWLCFFLFGKGSLLRQIFVQKNGDRTKVSKDSNIGNKDG
jgi:hypothetical protein